MNQLVFYTNPQSRSRVVHWLLEEIGQPYETVRVEFGPAMRTDDYLAINPMGKVPALKHGDAIVTETVAICAYLADRFPAAGLPPPANHPARAPYFRWIFFAAGPLEMVITAKTLDWTLPKSKRGFAGFGSHEKTLEPGPHICGEQFTAADVYMGSQLNWGMRRGVIEKRPIFESYVARILDRPAARRAGTLNENNL